MRLRQQSGNEKSRALGARLQANSDAFMQPSSLPRVERRAATSEGGPAKCHGGYMLRFSRSVKIEAINAAAFWTGIPDGPEAELTIEQCRSRQPHQLHQHGFAGI